MTDGIILFLVIFAPPFIAMCITFYLLFKSEE